MKIGILADCLGLGFAGGVRRAAELGADAVFKGTTVDGVYDEQDASGNDVAVPRFNLLFVDKIE